MSDTTLSSKTVKIRKPCKCFGCGLYSLKGQEMVKQTQIVDGEFLSAAFCMTCDEFLCRFDDDYWDGVNENELRIECEDEWMRVHREVLGLDGATNPKGARHEHRNDQFSDRIVR